MIPRRIGNMKCLQCFVRKFFFVVIASWVCVSLACKTTSLPVSTESQPIRSEVTSHPEDTVTSTSILPVSTESQSIRSEVTSHPEDTVTSTSMPIVGVGILGDSNSDEYRADDNRGGSYDSHTYGWMELVFMYRKLNFGKWGNWGEPRRTGFEYNWARTSATAHSMIETGQQTGLAQQVANGEVSHVIIWIGSNDFTTWNGTYQEIYDGRLKGDALQAKIKMLVDDITLAVDTVLRAGKVNLLLVTIADRNTRPDIIAQFPDADKRKKVSDAIRATNRQLIALSQSHRIAVVDIDILTQSMSKKIDASGILRIGNEQIDVFHKGNEPHYGLLDDETGHPGTILSGLIANEIFIKPFNQYFGTNIQILNDQEILQSAGLLTR
jgi:hypothetical protein